MKKHKMLFAGLTAAALAMLLVVAVSAASTRYNNYVGSSDAVAKQTVSNINASRWRRFT